MSYNGNPYSGYDHAPGPRGRGRGRGSPRGPSSSGPRGRGGRGGPPRDYGRGGLSNRRSLSPPSNRADFRKDEEFEENVPRRHQRDANTETHVIQQRVKREKPCRTLFVRNIKYDTPSQEVREKFERMGDIKTFFDLLSTRGMVFITYFDVRASEMAKNKLQDSLISSRPIDCHFSLPREEDRSKRCDAEQNQGTLMVTVTGTRAPINEFQLKQKMQQFGDIQSIYPCDNQPYQRYVEYFDSRDCVRAQESLDNSNYMGGMMELRFVWDLYQADPVPSRSGGIKSAKYEDPQQRSARDYPRGPSNSSYRDGPTNRDGSSMNRDGPTNRDGSSMDRDGPMNRDGSMNRDGPLDNRAPHSVNSRLSEAQRLQDLLAGLVPNQPPAPNHFASNQFPQTNNQYPPANNQMPPSNNQFPPAPHQFPPAPHQFPPHQNLPPSQPMVQPYSAPLQPYPQQSSMPYNPPPNMSNYPPNMSNYPPNMSNYPPPNMSRVPISAPPYVPPPVATSSQPGALPPAIVALLAQHSTSRPNPVPSPAVSAPPAGGNPPDIGALLALLQQQQASGPR